MMTEIKIVVAFEGGMIRKGHKKTFWRDENILSCGCKHLSKFVEMYT